MSLNTKKIVAVSVFFFVALASILTAVVITADAVGEKPLAYQDGTSYSSFHDMQDTTIWNYADEAHGLYIFYQNSDLLPVDVQYSVIAHEEADIILTMKCTVEIEVKYKWLWFDRTFNDSDMISGDSLVGKGYVTGHMNGPDSDATSIKTVYCFYDAVEGKCVWTIVGE